MAIKTERVKAFTISEGDTLVSFFKDKHNKEKVTSINELGNNLLRFDYEVSGFSIYNKRSHVLKQQS